jgi:hypothetical protein
MNKFQVIENQVAHFISSNSIPSIGLTAMMVH